MTDPASLDYLADLLEQAADILALFAHHAKHGGEVLDATRQTALKLALDLMPEADKHCHICWIGTRPLRHSVAATLLHLVSLSRTREATPVSDGAMAARLAYELIEAANTLRLQAAGLE